MSQDMDFPGDTRSRDADIDFYKFIISSLPAGVLTVNSDLRITSFNPWAEEITGYRQEEVVGRYCGDVLQGGQCDRNCPLRTVLESRERVVRIETTIRNRENELLPVRMTTGGLFDDQGKLIGGLEAFQDISRLKALEREKNNMISMLAHDMKSPLISIDGFMLRLIKTTSEKKRKQYMDIMLKEIRKLEYLIEEFLECSRLQSGKLKLEYSPTSLDKELHELLESFRVRALKKKIQIEFCSSQPIPMITADTKRINRVFSNLLDNAIKFSSQGTAIRITVENQTEEIVVQIADEGTGIDAAELPYIFEPFHRANGLQKRTGFGLGLAAVKSIVEGHGGRVSVKSEPGEGSVFTVCLPKEIKLEDEFE